MAIPCRGDPVAGGDGAMLPASPRTAQVSGGMAPNGKAPTGRSTIDRARARVAPNRRQGMGIVRSVVVETRRPSLVAVITPTFNRARYLSLAIESVLRQSFDAWELHVVDDGSTDETRALAKRFRDSRIRWTWRPHEGPTGLAAAYNRVIAQTNAKLVAVLDDDDLWPPDKLHLQVKDFEDPNVVLSYGRAGLLDACGCLYGVVVPSVPHALRTNLPVGSILRVLLLKNPIVSSTVVIRKQALETIGGFWQPEGVPFTDHPTWIKLALRGTFAYHDHIVGYWRRHRGQVTAQHANLEAAEPAELRYILDFLSEAEELRPLAPRILAEARSTLRRRDLLTLWRRTLLDGEPHEVLQAFTSLLASRNPTLMAAAAIGLLLWLGGSDLEWVQRMRRRAAWPGRHHAHRVVVDNKCSRSTSQPHEETR